METIAFLSNRNGIGTSTLIYHLAYMLAEKGKRVLMVDLDRQAGLSSKFFSYSDWKEIYSKGQERETIFQTIRPFLIGENTSEPTKVHKVSDNLGLIAGDYILPLVERKLNDDWRAALGGEKDSVQSISLFHTMVNKYGESFEADFCFLDLGIDLNSTTRSGFIAADYAVLPIGFSPFTAADFSLLSYFYFEWNNQWKKIESYKGIDPTTTLNKTKPLGVFLTHSSEMRSLNPFAEEMWALILSRCYKESPDSRPSSFYKSTGAYLGLFKPYFTLMDLAKTSRKPVFQLSPADGAIGSQTKAVQSAHSDIEQLLEAMLNKMEA